LAHAGEARDAYGDQMGFMGYGYFEDDTYMCFNAVNNYQLGWYDNQYADVSPTSSMGGQAFVLNGVESAGSTGAANGKKIAVRVTNVFLEDSNLCCTQNYEYYTGWKTRDIYIGYNYVSGAATGLNRDTKEYQNSVTVHQKNGLPSSYADSWLLAVLAVGQEKIFPNFDGSGKGYNLHIKFVNVFSEDAFVEVFTSGGPTPTNAPTKVPTVAPTPTRVPTRAPTRVPTRAPTRVPTRAPTRVPTRAPTRVPTRAPTRVPTSATKPTKRPR
jgi:hypothetical protein